MFAESLPGTNISDVINNETVEYITVGLDEVTPTTDVQQTPSSDSMITLFETVSAGNNSYPKTRISTTKRRSMFPVTSQTQNNKRSSLKNKNPVFKLHNIKMEKEKFTSQRRRCKIFRK